MTATYSVQPRVYVACLASYNNGMLHGRWIDADQDVDDIWAEINAMLKASPVTAKYGDVAEEWAIHDYEYMGKLSEYESIENVAKIGALVAEHGEAFLAFLKFADDDEIDSFEERYRGEWESEKDFAYQQVEDLGWGGLAAGSKVKYEGVWPPVEVDVFEALGPYLDWDMIVREMFDHGDCHFVDGFVFEGG